MKNVFVKIACAALFMAAVSCTEETIGPNETIKSPRDSASGQATGVSQNHELPKPQDSATGQATGK